MGENNELDLIEYAKNTELPVVSSENEYNDTDAVVLSTIEYLNLEEVDVSYTDPTLGNYIKQYLDDNKDKYIDPNRKALAEAIKDNPRYKDLKVENIQSHFSENEPEQFAAMTVVLPEGQKVAVFRGTDGSNSGWWEDLCFGYNTDPEGTVAQKMAKEYIENIKDTDCIYITGHSKGGGLAVWAALFCGYVYDEQGNVVEIDNEVRRKIMSVINLDGPGTRDDILDKIKDTPEYKELMEQVGDNWYTIVPQESVVGYIMTDPEKYKIVTSDAYSSFDNFLNILFQHDTFTWQFNDGQLDCGDINSGKTGLFSQFVDDTLDDSMNCIPKGMLQRVSDTSFKITGKILDDEISEYFNDLGEAFDDSFFDGIEKLGEGGWNVISTGVSFLYSIAVIKEEIKFNLQKIAAKYGVEKLKEGAQYVEKEFECFKDWCESGIDKLSDKAENLWDSLGIKLSELWGDNSDESSNYIAVNASLIGGLDIIGKSLSLISYDGASNMNPVNMIGKGFINGIQNMINDVFIDSRAWEYVLSMQGLDNTSEANKFVKALKQIGINMSQYINQILLSETRVKASELTFNNVSICNGNGQIGLEFNLVPEINKIIDNVVDNLNVSIADCLDDINSKLNGLEYTSFSLDIDYCRQSLNNQKNSLHDFKEELRSYDNCIKNMENDIIGKLNTITCDC